LRKDFIRRRRVAQILPFLQTSFLIRLAQLAHQLEPLECANLPLSTLRLG